MISCVHGVPPSPEEGVNIQVELWISSIHEYGDQPVGVLQIWPLEHLTVAIPACSHDRVLIPLNRDNVDQEFRMDKADVSLVAKLTFFGSITVAVSALRHLEAWQAWIKVDPIIMGTPCWCCINSRPWQGWRRGVTSNGVLQLNYLGISAIHLQIGFQPITNNLYRKSESDKDQPSLERCQIMCCLIIVRTSTVNNV